jgi:hypothetical protein
MPAPPSYDHEFRFSRGERYSFSVVPYERIESDIPERAGIYSWHFRLPPQPTEAVSVFLDKLYVSSSIKVDARSNMRQSWSGTIATTAKPFRSLHNKTLSDFFFALGYPLYIGISRNLKRRLETHKNQLEAHRRHAFRQEQSKTLSEDNPESDTAEESTFFGRRLGTIFNQSEFTETDCLFIKHYSPPQCAAASHCGSSEKCLMATMDELRKAEWTCNTLFHPALGRL